MATIFNITLNIPARTLIYSINIEADEDSKRFIITCESTKIKVNKYMLLEQMHAILYKCSELIIASGSECLFECSRFIGGSKKLSVQPLDLTAPYKGLLLNCIDVLRQKLIDFVKYDYDKWIQSENSKFSGDEEHSEFAIEITDEEDTSWTSAFEYRFARTYSSAW